MSKLNLRVTKVAFYNDGLVYPNEIIKNYKGETIPSWATLANGKDEPVQKDETIVNTNGEAIVNNDANTETGNTEVIAAGDGGVHEVVEGEADENETTVEQTEAEIMEEYNTLLDEAVEKNILLEDADKKTIVEQIAELKKLLGKE